MVWSEEHRTKFLHIVGNQKEESGLNSMLSNKLQRHVKNLIPPLKTREKTQKTVQDILGSNNPLPFTCSTMLSHSDSDL